MDVKQIRNKTMKGTRSPGMYQTLYHLKKYQEVLQ